MIIETAYKIINKQGKSVMSGFFFANYSDLCRLCRQVGAPCIFHSRYQVNFARLRVRLKIEQHKYTRKFLQ